MPNTNEVIRDVKKLDFKLLHFVRLVERYSFDIKFNYLNLVVIGGSRDVSCKEEFRICISCPHKSSEYRLDPLKMVVQHSDSLGNAVSWEVNYEEFVRWALERCSYCHLNDLVKSTPGHLGVKAEALSRLTI